MSDYSALERQLHRTGLGSSAVAEITHDIERACFLRSAPADHGGHLFVTGLARAGTTILMRQIHETGQFGSLTYADMPFVLAPNLWARLRGSRAGSSERKERAHGDGIEVDQSSPEEFDEVYWRVVAGDDYIRADRLVPHVPDPDMIEGYRDYIRLILRRTGKRRYLSKNNNNILRLAPLAAAMPDSLFLVPLRDPIDHARSLLRQHNRFLKADPFTHDYMTWLGHHEFGSTHRPFCFGKHMEGDAETLEYWLAIWIAVHDFLGAAERTAANIMFVPYEPLCRDPAIWHAIARRIGIEPSPATLFKTARSPSALIDDSPLVWQARQLHASLLARTSKLMSGGDHGNPGG